MREREEPAEDELVRLYPLLPYQIQLLIDAVSVRRAQGGSSPTVGGSSRTIIKHAQQLIVHPKHGLGIHDIGSLVTLDRSYELLEELIPTSWRAEIEQVADRYGYDSLEAKVIKAVALCVEVPALPLTAENIAVLLHPDITAESLRDKVTQAIGRLMADDRLRETDDGYKLQSPEQKDWEQARRTIDLTQGPSVRLRRLLIKSALSALTVSKGRAFKIDVSVEGETVVPGDLPLHIDEANPARREELRSASRENANANRLTWTYELSPNNDTWNALLELHRSRTMIERRDTPNKTPTEVELLGEERERERRLETTTLQRIARDLAAGQLIFRGRVDGVDGGDLRTTAQRLVSDRLDEIYPQLEQFTANIRRDDVMTVLRTTNLGLLPEALRDSSIGLIRVTPSGYELVTDSGPLAALAAEIRTRASYGHEATGSYLESHFAAPPYGAQVEVVQALCAAGLRAGLLEVIHQGQRIANPSDARLDQVFGTLPRFRAAAFRPPALTDFPLERRVDLAEKLEHLTGQAPSGYATDVLAGTIRSFFLPGREAIIRVQSALGGIGIPVPAVVARTRDIIERLGSNDDLEVVKTAHDTWADLVPGRKGAARLDEFTGNHLEDLRAAKREASRSPAGLTADMAAKHAELLDLLASGDLVAHAARIGTITHQLTDSRNAAASEAAERLRIFLIELRSKIAERYGDLGQVAVDEALRPIDALAPPDDLSDIDAVTLETRIDSARNRAEKATHQLDELRAAGHLAWVRVSDLVTDAITSEEELDPVLERIREAVAAELADGKHVRLQ